MVTIADMTDQERKLQYRAKNLYSVARHIVDDVDDRILIGNFGIDNGKIIVEAKENTIWIRDLDLNKALELKAFELAEAYERHTKQKWYIK